jgi:hypothetical protein
MKMPMVAGAVSASAMLLANHYALEPSPLLPYGMADHYSEDSSFSHFAATSTSLMSLT